jgi:hypothetical protein
MYQQRIVECDLGIESRLPKFETRVDPASKPLPPDHKRNRAGKKRRQKNGHPNPGFDLRTEAYKLFGVDVTQIPGLEENVLSLFSEVGREMSKWPSAGHLASWTNLCPDNDISGGKTLWRGVRKVKTAPATCSVLRRLPFITAQRPGRLSAPDEGQARTECCNHCYCP